jgi:general secretion pathway protein L
MKSIGIDIGASSIKVVEVTANNKGSIKLTQFIEHPLNSNPAFDPEIQIIEFLKNLSQGYDPADTRFILGLPQSRVSVRHKTFPFADRIKINKSLPFELEEELPFSADNAIFDAKIIKTHGSSAEVLACATPKSKVADWINRFGDVGFEISVLSAEGIALANCYEPWFEAPPAGPSEDIQVEGMPRPERFLHLLISIGHTNTLLHAIEGRRLVAVRSIAWGGKQVAEAIAKRYEIPYVEALKEMQSKAFILPNREGASYDQLIFSDTISMQFRDLCRDIKISMLELKSELGASIDSAEISGGASQVMDLSAHLTQALEIPVNKAVFLDAFQTANFEKNPHVESVIGVALGLAIEGLKKPRNPALQFLRGEFAKENKTFKKFWHTWGVSVQFLLAVYIAFFIYSVIRDSSALSLADRSIETLKVQGHEVAKLPKKLANEKGITTYIKEQKKRAQDLKTLSGLNVKRLNIEETNVVFEATVSTPLQATAIQNALKSVSSDGKISVLNPTMSAPPGSTTMAISFRVDRGVK